MLWVGALIGLSVGSPEVAASAGLIWLFPLTFLSNAFVPTPQLPSGLQPVAEWNPISSIVAACRHLFGNPSPFASPDGFPAQHPVWLSPDLVRGHHRRLRPAGRPQVPQRNRALS